MAMHKLYLGSTDLLERQLARDIRLLKEGRSLRRRLVLVESNLAGVYLRRRLAFLGGSHCAVSFYTLKDLAREMLSRGGELSALEPLPLYGEEWLAALVAREGKAGYFQPVAEQGGFARTLLQTFRDLEEAGLEELPSISSREPERLAALQALYRSFQRRKEPFLCQAKLFRRAASLAPGADLYPLFIYGCFDLPPLEKEFLGRLFDGGAVTIYWPEAVIRHKASRELMDWLLDRGFVREELSFGEEAPGNLGRLQRSLVHPSSGEAAPAPDSTVKLISAPEETREAQEIAREMINLAEEGLGFGEMAVLVRDPSYYSLLAETFTAHGIPFYLATGIPLGQTRSGRGLILFLELVGGDFPRAEVMDLVTYAPLDFKKVLGLGEEAVSPALWDYLTMEAGITRGREQWFRSLDRLRKRLQHQVQEAGEEAGEEEPDLYGAREHLEALDRLCSFLELLFNAVERFPLQGSWSEFAGACSDFMVNFFSPGEETQALLDLLKQLGRLDRCGERADFKPARTLLNQVLQQSRLPAGRFQQEGVNVLPLSSAAVLRFKAVFIPGLVDKNFPAPVQIDPLLPEAEREAIPGLAPRRRRLAQQSLDFALALGSASRKLVLSWPRQSGQDNREHSPSFYLINLMEALWGSEFAGKPITSWPGLNWLPSSFLEPEARPINEAEFDLKAVGELAPPLGPQEYLQRVDPWLAQTLRADRARSGETLTEYDGFFPPGGEACRLLSLRLQRSRGMVGATALETYARCPYAYFMGRLLRLPAVEEPEESFRLDPLERGQWVHRVLERFYRRLLDRGLFPLSHFEAACRQLLDEVCREHFSLMEEEGLLEYPLLLETAWEQIRDSLQALLTFEMEDPLPLRPEQFEVFFGAENAGGPVSLELPDGEKIYFRGRIDRIDRAGDAIRIIDYKTGRKKGRDESLEGGTALQLPVYLLAAARLFRLPDLEQATACYYFLDPAGVKRVAFSGAGWPEKEEQLKETVAVLYRGIREGRFFPFPMDEYQCRYCAYKYICGPEIKYHFQGKLSDRRLEDFLKLKE